MARHVSNRCSGFTSPVDGEIPHTILYYIMFCLPLSSLCRSNIIKGTAEKEVQDTSCRGSGGVPQIYKSPKIGGYRGLIESISAVSFRVQITIKECLIGIPLRLLKCFNIMYNDNRRKDILRMVKYMSWEQVGVWWIWKNHGYIRMLLISVAIFRLFSPTLLN